MRRIDIIRRAGKSLRLAKKRTILTSLAIAVGATTVAVAIAAAKGGNAYVESLANKIGDQRALTVIRAVKARDPYAPNKISTTREDFEKTQTEESIKSRIISKEDLNKISKVKGVRKASPAIPVSAETVRIENGEKYDVGVATKNDEQEMELSAGKLDKNNRIDAGKIVAPKAYVEVLGGKKPEDIIGKKVILEFKDSKGEIFEKTFEIQAVDAGKTETTFSYKGNFWIENSDGLAIATKQNEGDPQFYSLSVTTDGSRTVDEIKKDILALNGGSYYDVSTFADDKAIVQAGINAISAGLAGFGFLTLLAAVFGIINTQYISVLERTSQIGLMKSLGMRKSDVSKLFRYEAALIGLIGGIIGIVVAYGITFLNPVIKNALKLQNTAGVDTNLLQPNWLAWILLVLVLMIISILSGYLPARKAAKMNPIEALRTE
ncbi:MAG: ABC transporter permease [Candidatus Nanogingivalaceae bacterium]|nr:MAG: ABC transporter permease [Candidatus Nanogingivalaceae bacterium]QWB91538.1 MAG: ABC transporter permease [Candidatus Nanogingivalaceae bacterium]